MNSTPFLDVYDCLFQHYGPRAWWPAETAFEVMVGAILTQNTSWTNVERALVRLRDVVPLEPGAIAGLSPERLGEALRPAGYFNVKTKRLQTFCRWLVAQGGEEPLTKRDTHTLRHELLAVHGIGPETADDILLYAFGRPVFVVDAYTRRLFARLGLIQGDEPYEELRARFEQVLAKEAGLYNEYHALIVEHAKTVCRPRPLCSACVLKDRCPAAGANLAHSAIASKR